MIVAEAQGVSKHFIGGDGGRIDVLVDVDLQVNRGEMVAIVGSSGSGKSTLLHMLGALDRPTAGRILVGGMDLHSMPDDALARLRNVTVGFVFQFHHLLKEFSALENVMLPMRIAGRDDESAAKRANSLLDRVGLSARKTHRPHEMSGGEQQRTAVARALAAEPALLLADEPSGNLDHSHSQALHDLFGELAAEFGIGIAVVTHNSSLAARAHRVLLLEGGKLRQSTVGEMSN